MELPRIKSIINRSTREILHIIQVINKRMEVFSLFKVKKTKFEENN